MASFLVGTGAGAGTVARIGTDSEGLSLERAAALLATPAAEGPSVTLLPADADVEGAAVAPAEAAGPPADGPELSAERRSDPVAPAPAAPLALSFSSRFLRI